MNTEKCYRDQTFFSEKTSDPKNLQEKCDQKAPKPSITIIPRKKNNKIRQKLLKKSIFYIDKSLQTNLMATFLFPKSIKILSKKRKKNQSI